MVGALLELTDFELPFLMDVDPQDLALAGRQLGHRLMERVRFRLGQPIEIGPIDIRLTTHRLVVPMRIRTSTIIDPRSLILQQSGCSTFIHK